MVAPSRLGKRGVCAIVTKREAGCDGRISVARRAALLRTAKSCGPGAPGLAPSVRGDDLARDGDYEVTDTGEITYKPEDHRAGKAGCSANPVATAACFLLCRRAMGAACTRPSLRPLRFFRGRRRCTTRAPNAARTRTCVLMAV